MEKARERLERTLHAYKLVLMDINMPIMDGIDATVEIRRIENEIGGERSTILALTAADTEKNALRQQFKDFGMDDLIGKPLSKKAFQELLCKYIG